MPIEIPATHRESKKERTRAVLIENAIALFKEHGFGSTRLADVAQRSGVAPATLFNYFPAKVQLAEAWLRGEIDSIVEETCSPGASGRPPSLRIALRRAVRRIAGDTAAEVALRRETWRAVPRVGSGRFRHPSALIEGIRAEQQSEHVRSDLSPEALAELVLDGVESGLVAALIEGDALASAASERSIAALAEGLAEEMSKRADLILDGARKRNERVRPDAVSRDKR